mmetsp:Transcript_20260/g.64078  ORF Transcript_20260/g.64078 Transcript_20260/m.64078 type:complete len:355 (-) Transcript_20260:507-1571(-)
MASGRSSTSTRAARAASACAMRLDRRAFSAMRTAAMDAAGSLRACTCARARRMRSGSTAAWQRTRGQRTMISASRSMATTPAPPPPPAVLISTSSEPTRSVAMARTSSSSRNCNTASEQAPSTCTIPSNAASLLAASARARSAAVLSASTTRLRLAAAVGARGAAITSLMRRASSMGNRANRPTMRSRDSSSREDWAGERSALARLEAMRPHAQLSGEVSACVTPPSRGSARPPVDVIVAAASSSARRHAMRAVLVLDVRSSQVRARAPTAAAVISLSAGRAVAARPVPWRSAARTWASRCGPESALAMACTTPRAHGWLSSVWVALMATITSVALRLAAFGRAETGLVTRERM